MLRMHPPEIARLVMETVGELHDRGYGRLKLFCYIKEGLGVWRNFLFVGDNFPGSISQLPKPILSGSIPWLSTPTVEGGSPVDAADNFIKTHPEFSSLAVGRDDIYVNWYKNMLRLHKAGVLEMESPFVAKIDGIEIDTPYQSGAQY
jgi:hypothetical protein